MSVNRHLSFLAALVALVLSLALAACGDSGTGNRKTAADGIIHDPTNVRVVIHKGNNGFVITYSDPSYHERIVREFAGQGIKFTRVRVLDDGRAAQLIFEPFFEDQAFTVDLTGVRDISERGYGGFAWSPTHGERLS